MRTYRANNRIRTRLFERTNKQQAVGVQNEGRAYVLPGEDAAAAAFRFGEVHGGHYKRGAFPALQVSGEREKEGNGGM